MNKEAWEILLKFAPISGSLLFLGIAGIKAFVAYQVKKDNQSEVFFKEQLAKKDDIILRKDLELRELHYQVMGLITKNIEVANALKGMIKKALNKIPDDDDDDK